VLVNLVAEQGIVEEEGKVGEEVKKRAPLKAVNLESASRFQLLFEVCADETCATFKGRTAGLIKQ
jgi:hypothetical protein